MFFVGAFWVTLLSQHNYLCFFSIRHCVLDSIYWLNVAVVSTLLNFLSVCYFCRIYVIALQLCIYVTASFLCFKVMFVTRQYLFIFLPTLGLYPYVWFLSIFYTVMFDLYFPITAAPFVYVIYVYTSLSISMFVVYLSFIVMFVFVFSYYCSSLCVCYLCLHISISMFVVYLSFIQSCLFLCFPMTAAPFVCVSMSTHLSLYLCLLFIYLLYSHVCFCVFL